MPDKEYPVPERHMSIWHTWGKTSSTVPNAAFWCGEIQMAQRRIALIALDISRWGANQSSAQIAELLSRLIPRTLKLADAKNATPNIAENIRQKKSGSGVAAGRQMQMWTVQF